MRRSRRLPKSLMLCASVVALAASGRRDAGLARGSPACASAAQSGTQRSCGSARGRRFAVGGWPGFNGRAFTVLLGTTGGRGLPGGTVRRGVGDGTFGGPQRIVPHFGVPTVGGAVADFDGDGRPDLAFSEGQDLEGTDFDPPTAHRVLVFLDRSA